MKKRVGIWIRVSTEDQARGESPEHHEERARMYAELRNWEVVTVYNLAGTSGKSVIEHPEAQRMLSDIQSGKISGLIFSKLARFARNTIQLLEFAKFFREHEADLISIYENIDTSTPAGRLFYTMISAMAEWEREEIQSRIQASVMVRAKLGKKLGGEAQFGYTWEDGKLILNEKEAPIRKLVFELFVQQKRKTTVANILNQRGYRTRRGSKFSRNTIDRWLRDPISKGLRRSHYSHKNSSKSGNGKPIEEWFFHPAPAIVSEELWQTANDILAEQDKNKRPIKNRKVHIFTGHIFCHCGSTMSVRSRLTHYSCTSEHCNNKIIRGDLEEAFKSRLVEFLSDRKELEQYFAASSKGVKQKEQELKLMKAKLTELKTKIEGLLQLHSQGQIPTESFQEYHKEPYEQSEQLKNNIHYLEHEIKTHLQGKESTKLIMKESKNIFQQWNSFGRDKKREIIEAILDTVIIGRDEITFNLKRLFPTASPFSSKEGKMGIKPQR